MIKKSIRLVVILVMVLSVSCFAAAKPTLKFKTDGTFKVLLMSDLQDGPKMDARTKALSEQLIETEKPDFVVIDGDCISGGRSRQDINTMKQAMSEVASVFEQHMIPWAVVLGNHDTEVANRFPFTREDAIKIYMKYPYNLNKPGPKNIHGSGNDCLLINDSANRKPLFDIWLLDSGMYAPKKILNFTKGLKDVKGDNGWHKYEWIHTDQVIWYYDNSVKLEKRYGAKIPGLMFFHIGLQESVDMTTYGNRVGNKYEGTGCSSVNSGLFAAILERGDVKGVFNGHDHLNSFAGDWMGVLLGNDASNTFAAYNMPDSDPRSKQTRGGRVFLLNEKDPWNYKTWMRYIDGSQGPVMPKADNGR